MYDPIAARRAELERQIASAQRSLENIQSVPTDDVYKHGTIIRAEISYGSGDVTTYVFLKIISEELDVVRWYHTGQISHNPTSRGGGRRGDDTFFVSWREFQTWLIDRGRVVESWEILEPRCECNHRTPGRAHEDVMVDIADVLRFEYANTLDAEPKHMRVISKIMQIPGVYE
jgi:hypothetical protein